MAKWEWDIKEIREMQPADNVRELMVQNIEKLPNKCHRIITLASCIGAEFDIRTLAVISKLEQSEVRQQIQQILEEGMI